MGDLTNSERRIPDRKIYCGIVEGVTYEDHCIFALSKVIEANPTCENCILRELKKLKLLGVGKEKVDSKPREEIKSGQKKKSKTLRCRKKTKGDDINIKKIIKVTNVSNETNVSSKPRPVTENITTKHVFSIEALSKLLGKSRRRIQELAKEGKIPGAHKVGSRWGFSKEEIDRWLSKKEAVSPQGKDIVGTRGESPNGEDSRAPAQNSEGSSNKEAST